MVNLTKEIRLIGSDFKTEGQIEIYRFPADWSVREYPLPVRPGLSKGEVRGLLSRRFPYKGDTASLAALARGKRDVVILIDDLTRPTPAYDIAPLIVELLAGAGLAREQIAFLFAYGTHKPMTDEEMVLKLGEDLMRGYRVERHNPFQGDFVDLGHTSYGTPVMVNRRVVEADLVVALNTLAKHRFVYACGGSKMILPGVSHVETIVQNHKGMAQDILRQDGHKFGKTRLDMDEVAKKVAERTHLIEIDVTVSPLREVTSIYMGACVDTYRAHVDEALDTYVVEFDRSDYPSGKADIGFFRMGFHTTDPNQMSRSVDRWEEVCRVPVIITDCADRYYYVGTAHGPFDEYVRSLDGREALPNPPLAGLLASDKYSIVYSPHLDAKSTHLRKPHMYVASDWESLIGELYAHLEPNQRVAWFRDASIHILDVH
jgi:hypothetical protein